MLESPSSEIAKIVSFEAFNSEIYKVCLRLPDDYSFSFTAGQYLLLVLDEDDKRPFSIASAPAALPDIELHIRDVPGNEFIQKVIHKLQQADSIGIEGSFGKATLASTIQREITFIVGGTGFAPAKAIIEDLVADDTDIKVNLFRGARTVAEFYQLDLSSNWPPNVEFTPVVSEPDSNWQRDTGFVHNVAMENLGEDLQNHDIFIAGSIEMVLAVYRDLLASGIDKSQIHADMLDLLREQGELD